MQSSLKASVKCFITVHRLPSLDAIFLDDPQVGEKINVIIIFCMFFDTDLAMLNVPVPCCDSCD